MTSTTGDGSMEFESNSDHLRVATGTGMCKTSKDSSTLEGFSFNDAYTDASVTCLFQSLTASLHVCHSMQICERLNAAATRSLERTSHIRENGAYCADNRSTVDVGDTCEEPASFSGH